MTYPLTGISPDDPRPGNRREIHFAAGNSLAAGSRSEILIIGNKTSAGSETVNVVPSTPIRNEVDALARLGKGEAYWSWWAATRWQDNVDIYVACPTASAGTAADIDITFTGTAGSTIGWEIDFLGFTGEFNPADGAANTATATAFAAWLDNWQDGLLPITTAVVSNVVTITFIHAGPRGDDWLGDGANVGFRIRALGTNAQTAAKSALTNGATSDDWTTLIAAVANSRFAHHSLAANPVAAPTTTDNLGGEYLEMLRVQFLPENGKGQHAVLGSIGTVTQSTDVATASTVNTTLCDLICCRGSDWPPSMIAAYINAAIRMHATRYPGFSIIGLPLPHMPVQHLATDRYTPGEQRTLLNNGCTPILSDGKRVWLQRLVHTKCQNAAGDADYRAREGHIYHAVQFSWESLYLMAEANKQANVDDDPVGTDLPAPNTTYPSQVKGWIETICTTMSNPRPEFNGVTYEGPILRRGALAEMLAAADAVYSGGGKIRATANFEPVQHLIALETHVNQTGQGY